MEEPTGFQRSDTGPGPCWPCGSPELDAAHRHRSGSFSVRGKQHTLHLYGEVDVATCSALVEALDAVIAQRDGDVILDCSAVTFFGAAGVSALIGARNQLERSGRRVVVRNPSSIVRRVLDVVDLAELFADSADITARTGW